MASCGICGTKLGLGKSGLCWNCITQQQKEAAEAAATQLAAEQATHDAKVVSYVTNALSRIDALCAAQGSAYLYRQIHVDVDSMMEEMHEAGGIDMFDLNMAGAHGWEAIGVIPRTYSGSQSYISKNKMTATSFGGGSTTQRVSLSGNIVGVYLLLRLAVTPSTRAELDGVIRETLTKSVTERLGPRPD